MPRTKAFDERQVLQKAMELFWAKGYHATSMQDLVSHLGINRASLYGTFGDKQTLFRRAFDLYRSQNQQRIGNLMAGYPSVREGFTALFEGAIEETLQDEARKGCFVVNTVTALVPEDPYMTELLRENHENFVAFFQSYLEKAEASGEISTGKDLHAIATLLFTLHNGLKVVGKVAPTGEALKASVQVVLGLLQ